MDDIVEIIGIPHEHVYHISTKNLVWKNFMSAEFGVVALLGIHSRIVFNACMTTLSSSAHIQTIIFEGLASLNTFLSLCCEFPLAREIYF